jgi:hypothetical protein
MIRQTTLKAIVAQKAEVARLETTPAVREYLAAREALKEDLDYLRARVRDGEDVEGGRCQVLKRHSLVVSWEQFWKRIRETPAVARALLRDGDARVLLDQVARRDPAAEFVSDRVTIDVIG